MMQYGTIQDEMRQDETLSDDTKQFGEIRFGSKWDGTG